MPSAPMATPARETAGTRLRLPVAWLGSSITGRCVSSLSTGNRGDVAGVARGGFEGADAALAENHVGIAVRDDVFGGHEQFFDGGAEAALQQHGPAAFAERFQEHEVLHVARADLHDVGVLRDEIDVAIAHDFGDDAEAGRGFRFLQELQAFFFHALGNRRAKCAA